MKRPNDTSHIAYIVLLVVAVAAATIYGCTATGGNTSIASREEHFNYTLHFCSEGNCLQRLAELLSAAKESVKCAFYRADESLIGNILITSAAEIVVDEKAKIATADFNGTVIYKSKSKGIMHNKYCVIDNSTVITGSFNPTAAAKDDYNNVVIINSSALAGFYGSDFERLKLGSRGKTPTAAAVVNGKAKRRAALLNETAVEVYFCPEDDCAAAVKEKIKNASKTIIFAAYSFTHPEIANELIIKSSEETHVAGLIEKSTAGSKYSKYAAMVANGIDIKLEDSKKLMHHKFFVIDNETVITGSFNPTKNADERNDENMIMIRNKAVAEKYVEEFGRIRHLSNANQ